MARPDYIICLECESEVEEFSWREGEIRKAVCDVCGNSDPDAFSLPEDFEESEEAEADDEDDLEDDYEDYGAGEDEDEEEE
ncbi:MAG: hypothetical protein KA072_09650 [Thermoanaerobaculaceae bacterium]|nr:hypothetical protein [Thermoanaerobaculaceae bacterium]MDI9620935.1 hypothetical protein [Acidobacteriota bacterium]NLH10582.1 hypothetical protein [Holophagae bacterium]HPW56665.1 hypothetical protein [Thermoanaerobaculaceae bacterium]